MKNIILQLIGAQSLSMIKHDFTRWRVKAINSLIVFFLCLSAKAFASETYIEAVQVKKIANGTYNFSVTLKHADKSWEHYANLWQVETLQGELIAKRVLHHPHISEQPFTRSLSGVSIPSELKQVVIVAGCTVEGINSKKVLVKL